MSPSRPPGIVVLDTNVLKHFRDPELRARMLGSLRAANLQLQLSVLNVAEVVPYQSENRRRQLLSLIAELSDGVGLYPLPFELLRLAGQAALDGDDGFWLFSHKLTDRILEIGAITPKHAARAGALNADQVSRWKALYRSTRSTLTPYLIEEGNRDPWGSVAAFLDSEWARADRGGLLVQMIWQLLNLDGSPPSNLLHTQEVWRLHLDGLGANYYEQSVSNKTGKIAEPNDIAQLLFLALGAPRILVTEDKGLHRVAGEVFRGRYTGIRVMWARDFIASADRLRAP